MPYTSNDDETLPMPKDDDMQRCRVTRPLKSKAAPIPDTSPTWTRYADLKPLLKGDGLKLTANDYDYAAHCVNCHDELVECLKDALMFHGSWNKERARAAVAKATGGEP